MNVRVGVIGTGNIGTSHALSLQNEVSGAEVTAVFDANTARATEVATQLGARVVTSVEDLISGDDVDAVVIASPDELHAQQALACLAVGKPMMLEKPLAPTITDAQAVMDAEVSLGKRLITLGFMRRFDPGYLQLKDQLDSGAVGEALIVRNVHRNQSAPYGLQSERTMYNMAIHEIDINRWLLGEDYASVQVIKGRPGPDTPAGEFDPMIVMFTTTNGTVVEIEAFVNAHYGYEVACSVIASRGVLDMGDGTFITRTATYLRGQDIPELWLGRFAEAYRRELQAWIDAVRTGTTTGASTWDGFAATVGAQAAATAIRSGKTEPVELPSRPALYS